jgi:hypothetical protein
VNAQLQCVEVERAVPRDHELAVHHATLWKRRHERRHQLGKVPIERLCFSALDQDFVAIPEDQRSKAVPFRLEYPTFRLRQLADSLGEHGQERGIHGKLHPAQYSARLRHH